MQLLLSFWLLAMTRCVGLLVQRLLLYQVALWLYLSSSVVLLLEFLYLNRTARLLPHNLRHVSDIPN